MVNDELSLDGDTTTKVGFDGRMGYQQTLNQLIRMMHQYNIFGDFDMTIRLVKSIYHHTTGFLMSDDNKNIKTKITIVTRLLQIYHIQSDSLKNPVHMQNEIDNLIELLMSKTRHLLLPFDDSTDTEFTEEDFLRKSGLL